MDGVAHIEGARAPTALADPLRAKAKHQRTVCAGILIGEPSRYRLASGRASDARGRLRGGCDRHACAPQPQTRSARVAVNESREVSGAARTLPAVRHRRTPGGSTRQRDAIPITGRVEAEEQQLAGLAAEVGIRESPRESIVAVSSLPASGRGAGGEVAYLDPAARGVRRYAPGEG